MNEKGRPEGLAFVSYITEQYAGQYGAERFYFRLSKMYHNEGNHLNKNTALFKFVLQAKQEESAEEKLRREQLNAGGQRVADYGEIFHPVVVLQVGGKRKGE